MKTITILSGKGGVGKSSITASLALALSERKKIICADCDVDASNLSLVLGSEEKQEWSDLSTNEKAVFDLDKCNLCKKCFDSCYFDSIGWNDHGPFIKEFSCEGCGVCRIVCPQGAISMEQINNAKIGYSNSKYGFKIVSAQLNIGESGSGKVVSAVRKKAVSLGSDAEVMLIDSAAGVGCPVIASVTGSDYAIIVTEPTPSGFSDMKKALDVVKHFGIDCGIIINKFDVNEKYSALIGEYASENGLELLLKIPFDKSFAEALTEMIPIIRYDDKYSGLFIDLADAIIKKT